MKKLITICALCVCSVFGQYSNTITQHVMTASVGTRTTVNNIGQTVHYFYAVSSSRPGHTCGTANSIFSANMQGSYDGVTYFQLPQNSLGAVHAAGLNVARLYQAAGAFPFLAITVTTDTNCFYDVWYTGAQSAVAINPVTFFAFGLYGTTVIPAFVQTAASGDTTLINGGTNFVIGVYSLMICNKTANQTVSLYAGSSSTGTLLMAFPNMGTGQCQNFPINQFPVLTTNTGGGGGGGLGLTISLGNATEVDAYVWYRYE